jgi:hypothetical protein
MDINTAFLNGNIEEELYMVRQEGFVDPKDAGKVAFHLWTKASISEPDSSL